MMFSTMLKFYSYIVNGSKGNEKLKHLIVEVTEL